jgi:transcriptional regulator with XRE-family HTH domain
MLWYDPIHRTQAVDREESRAMSALANAIREWLKDNDKGIHGQNELAGVAGIRISSLSYIMNKEDANPRPETIKKLAVAMGIEGAVLTALLGYPVQASGDPDGKYVQMARELEAFPWLVRRLDDFLRLPEWEFEEAMDQLEFRRRRRAARQSTSSDQ